MMRVLLAGERRVPWAAPGWGRALRELGVDVVEWDWAGEFSSGLLGKMESRYLFGPGIARANHDLLRTAQRAAPDVILLYATWPIWPHTIGRLTRDFWVAGYHNDDPFGGSSSKVYFRYWKRAILHFHSHHVFRRQNVLDYQQAGVQRVRELLPFYLPWLDRPATLSEAERHQYASDVVFVGHAEKDRRIAHIEALVNAGLHVRLYGQGTLWRRYLPRSVWEQVRPVQHANGATYRKVIAGAKICLAFYSTLNRDEVTFRSFEIPACGGFLLSQRTPEMQRLYHEGEEVAMFGSPNELVAQCRYYLQGEAERKRVAAAGMRRCLESGYDIFTRMRQWLADTQAWMKECGWEGIGGGGQE